MNNKISFFIVPFLVLNICVYLLSQVKPVQFKRQLSVKINIIKPDGKTHWKAGSKQLIVWRTQGIDISSKVKISLFNESGKNFIRNIGNGSNGSFAWNVPIDLGGYYKIGLTRIIKASGAGNRKTVILAIKQDPFFSRKFHIMRKLSPKLIKRTLTLKAQIRDRHSSRRERGHGSNHILCKRDLPDFVRSIPGTARVGYYIANSDHLCRGFIFRSRLYFDVSRLKGKIIKKAWLFIDLRRTNYNYRRRSCAAKLYVLEGPWKLPVKCTDTPGYLLSSLQNIKKTKTDITSLVWDWAYGIRPNYGLLVSGQKERIDQLGSQADFRCITWYKAYVEVELK